jgi:hypothetical protein
MAPATRSAPKERKIRIAPGVAHREIEGRLLILVPGARAPMALNDSAAFLWRRLVRGSTGEALARALARHYGVDMSRARKDVATFLALLARRGLAISR